MDNLQKLDKILNKEEKGWGGRREKGVYKTIFELNS